jgi:hypothetical protein
MASPVSIRPRSNNRNGGGDDDDDNESLGKPLSSLSHHRGYFTTPSYTPTSASLSLFGPNEAFPGPGPAPTTLQALESACDIASQVMDLLGFEDSDDDLDYYTESNYDSCAPQ